MKKRLIIALIAVLLPVAGGAILSYFQNTTLITINYSHVTSVTIKDSGNEEVKTISQNKQQVRLNKDEAYQLEYRAEEGYADGKKSFNTDQKEVTISPYYSATELASLLREELSTITTSISTDYPKVNSLYTIDSPRLYHYGEWFGANLLYKGSDIFNADNLKIIAHKYKDKWIVMSNPPMPSLNIYNTGAIGSASPESYDPTHVPTDVLGSINTL